MTNDLSSFATRLRDAIEQYPCPGDSPFQQEFDALALELFALQFKHNPAYRKICEARQVTPATARFWAQVPFMPTGAFKELELSSLPPEARSAVFHSSGTTEQKPSRHFHSGESLALYEASLWRWFAAHFKTENEFVFLTPNPAAAPHSSLVHMFETVGKNVGHPGFFGVVGSDGAWTLDFDATIQKLVSAGDDRAGTFSPTGGEGWDEGASCAQRTRSIVSTKQPLTILGTAFSFVHLVDFLAAKGLRFHLPAGSRVMETGGYKNRSRQLPKRELHGLIARHLGVPLENIVCEYGMSELSSQAYDRVPERRSPDRPVGVGIKPDQETAAPQVRPFHFPPWARVQIISPETGHEVAEGETGLIRVFDLANVFSVAAIQTEDLGIRRGEGFELIGRAQLAEPRGCSLMNA